MNKTTNEIIDQLQKLQKLNYGTVAGTAIDDTINCMLRLERENKALENNLLNQFAGQAMQGLVGSSTRGSEQIAPAAYTMAEKMIQYRKEHFDYVGSDQVKMKVNISEAAKQTPA